MSDPELQDWARSEQGPGQSVPSIWPAAHGAGRGVGIALLVIELLAVAVGFWRTQSASGLVLWLLWLLILGMIVLGAITAKLVRGVGTMSYVIDDHRLTVFWTGHKHVIALAEIIEVEYDPYLPVPSSGWEPLWPGLVVWTRRRGDGIWRAWATLPPRGRVRIRTMTGGVEISPSRPIRFLVDIDRRRAGGPATAVEMRSQSKAGHWSEPAEPWREPDSPTAHDGPAGAEPAIETDRATRTELGLLRYAYRQLFHKEILGDRLSSNLIAVGVIIPLLMVVYLFSQLAGVADPVALHWDALGEVDRLGPPSALWQLPMLAAFVLVGNTVLATALVTVDRFLSRLMLAAIPIVQLVATVALVRAVG